VDRRAATFVLGVQRFLSKVMLKREPPRPFAPNEVKLGEHRDYACEDGS